MAGRCRSGLGLFPGIRCRAVPWIPDGPRGRRFKLGRARAGVQAKGPSLCSLCSPPAANALAHNSRAVPVLTFVAQLAGPPTGVCSLDVWAPCKLLRGAGNFISRAAAVNLPDLGGARFVLPSAACLSALGRTALDGKIEWREGLRALTVPAGAGAPIRALMEPREGRTGRALPS